MKYTTNRLAELNKDLQQTQENAKSNAKVFSDEEADLLELSGKCRGCAENLQHELKKLDSQRGTALEAIRISARAIRKKKDIEKAQERLRTYQATLETSLLFKLSNHFDVQALKNDDRFEFLGQQSKTVIACLVDGQTSFSALVAYESQKTRQHVTAQVDRMEKIRIDDRFYEQVTQSLFYPEIFARQEQVDNTFDGLENTYQWIFDEPEAHQSTDSKERPHWHDFAQWLREGQGVYWINGKAGSGKSTLMNYICNDNRRLELLKEWCSYRLLLTPIFFFWNAGSREQKSVEGLLRSLIYQMLTQCRELITCINKGPIHAWTERRLLTTFFDLFKQRDKSISTCIFIDGLDEFDGRYESVLHTIQSLTRQDNVKVCLSSRPLHTFQKAFGQGPGLRLQELVAQSIQEYVERQLYKAIKDRVFYENVNEAYVNEAYVNEMLSKIAQRAEGVFLWTVIAVREIKDGLEDFVELQELSKVVESLPRQLEDLFVQILNRIKPAYRCDTAKFLQIALYQNDTFAPSLSTPLDLCKLHLICSQLYFEHEDKEFRYQKRSFKELVEACNVLHTRLLTHTAGLLDLSPKMEHSRDSIDGTRIFGEAEDKRDLVLFTRVNFLHRTVVEFLLDNEEAKRFLALHGHHEVQIRLSIARGLLAQALQFSREIVVACGECPSDHFFFLFCQAMFQTARAEKIIKAPQITFMKSLRYEDFARGYKVTCRLTDYVPTFNHFPFVQDEAATAIEMMGMAAYAGMKEFVCEERRISTDMNGDSFHFPSSAEYSKRILGETTLQGTPEGLRVVGGPYFNDRKNRSRSVTDLSKHGELLERSIDSPTELMALSQHQIPHMDETYLLCCCMASVRDLRPAQLALARALLHAGANPMVRIASCPSAWYYWCEILNELRWNYMRVYGRSGGLLLRVGREDLQVTFTQILDITKGLLANGADINQDVISGRTSQYYTMALGSCLRRLCFGGGRFYLVMDATAQFVLQNCLSDNAEFRRFANDIKSLVRMPNRRITEIVVDIIHYNGIDERGKIVGTQNFHVKPTAEEHEYLWSIIETWEETGYSEDEEKVRIAIERIWLDHNPGVTLQIRR